MFILSKYLRRLSDVSIDASALSPDATRHPELSLATRSASAPKAWPHHRYSRHYHSTELRASAPFRADSNFIICIFENTIDFSRTAADIRVATQYFKARLISIFSRVIASRRVGSWRRRIIVALFRGYAYEMPAPRYRLLFINAS